MALVLNGVKYLVLPQAEEGIFITGCCNKSLESRFVSGGNWDAAGRKQGRS